LSKSCQKVVKNYEKEKLLKRKVVKNYEKENIGNIGQKDQLAELPQKNVTFCHSFYYIKKS
jgi:hypothetical protein